MSSYNIYRLFIALSDALAKPAIHDYCVICFQSESATERKTSAINKWFTCHPRIIQEARNPYWLVNSDPHNRWYYIYMCVYIYMCAILCVYICVCVIFIYIYIYVLNMYVFYICVCVKCMCHIYNMYTVYYAVYTYIYVIYIYLYELHFGCYKPRTNDQQTTLFVNSSVSSGRWSRNPGNDFVVHGRAPAMSEEDEPVNEIASADRGAIHCRNLKSCFWLQELRMSLEKNNE